MNTQALHTAGAPEIWIDQLGLTNWIDQFGAKNESPPPRSLLHVLFWTKYVVPRQIKPGILKLTIRKGYSNFSIVFIFISCKEKAIMGVIGWFGLDF